MPARTSPAHRPTVETRRVASDLASSRVSASGRRAAAAWRRSQKISLQGVSLGQAQSPRPPPISDRRADDFRTEVAGVGIANGPGGDGDGHTFTAFDIVRREVCVMDDQHLWNLASEANSGRQRQVNSRGVHIRQPVDGQGRLMGYYADQARPADLRPEHRRHVVPELGPGESGEAIHAACFALDVSPLGELPQADVVQACRSRRGRGEVAALVYGDLEALSMYPSKVHLPLTVRPGPAWIAWPLAGLLTVLLFVGGPGHQGPRSLSSAWDLGHIVLFSVWSCLLRSIALRRVSLLRQWATVLAFCIVAGGVTEGIQSVSGGDASIGDFVRDILGGVLALCWCRPALTGLPRSMRHLARGASLSLLLVALLPLIVSASDEWMARVRFPVLSDFETPFEADRWESDARFAIDRSEASHGEASLRVDMDTSLYSGVALVHFPRNWTGYRYFRMEVLNPSPDQVDLNCRLHDGQHERRGPTYTDRYNTAFRLRPGWNSLRIDLADVARAPAGRRMDMADIRGLIVFCSRLPAPHTIFIDDVRLE